MKRTALVTGANRGIGFEVSRQLARAGLRVVLTARDEALGEAACHTLRREGLDVLFAPLDVSREDSVKSCASELAHQLVQVDVLVNNAGVYQEGNVLHTSTEVMEETLAVNLLGPWWMCRAFVPGMVHAGYGRVVNVSSGAGAFSGGLPGPAAYAVTKAALNALTLKLASEVPDHVKVNAVFPGWVRTRMGGEAAPRSVEEGADTVVWLAMLPEDGPTGGFFRDRRPIPW
ncbi:MAG: SDR family oxidoreductase [Myxococcaceae bacterium]|nr:SDR family oxidoreductase [Myxococcaceae bacterium]MCI0670896.1 SDR family oxidoreductase [Myxococcaceae bacterium]